MPCRIEWLAVGGQQGLTGGPAPIRHTRCCCHRRRRSRTSRRRTRCRRHNPAPRWSGGHAGVLGDHGELLQAGHFVQVPLLCPDDRLPAVSFHGVPGHHLVPVQAPGTGGPATGGAGGQLRGGLGRVHLLKMRMASSASSSSASVTTILWYPAVPVVFHRSLSCSKRNLAPRGVWRSRM